MKKLLFATALAASAAAFADPINAIGFEDSNYTNHYTFVNGEDEFNEVGTGSKFFYFDTNGVAGASNSSVVTNESPSTNSTKRTGYFTKTGASNEKYLALDTEGGTFWRSINPMTGGVLGLGPAQAVASSGTYLDTLVQFTVTEDDAPTVGEGDKLAIWLQAGEGTTNLMVRAAVVSTATSTPTTFVLDASVVPGEWYRLTVKAVADITGGGEEIPGFQIYLDGTLLTSDTITLDSGYLALLENDPNYADIAAGKYFASLSSATTLQGVGFQGTGAVDEIVWTEEDPFPASAVEFTLTWDEKVTAVSYVLSADTATTNTLTSGTAATIAAGTTGTIELIPTFASGYEFDYVDMGGTQFGLTFAVPTESTNAALVAKASVVKLSFTLAWGSNIDGVTYTVNGGESQTATNGTLIEVDPNAAIVVTVTYAANYQAASGNPTTSFTVSASGSTYTYNAEPIPAAYPTYIDTSDATIKAKYDAWKTKVGYDDTTASSHLNQFLLDVDEETTVGDAALEITEIKQNETAGWDITIGCTVSGASLTGTVGSTIVCNGYLAVSYANELNGTWTTENIAITAVDTTTGTVTVNVNKNNAKFMKVSLTAAPQPSAGE